MTLLTLFLVGFALTPVYTQSCVRKRCTRDLLDRLFLGNDKYHASVFSSKNEINSTMRTAYDHMCSDMTKLIECVSNTDPDCLETPLLKACIKVVEAACTVHDYFKNDPARDSCVTSRSTEPPYQHCLFKAKAAAHIESKDAGEQFCAIVTGPYLEYESCRLTAYSNGGCAAAVHQMQPYVEAILGLQTEACKACNKDCLTPRICDVHVDCAFPLLMQQFASTFRPYPPTAADYIGACQEWQTFTNCRQLVDPRCLSQEFHQGCFGVQTSTCAAAEKFVEMGKNGDSPAFAKLDTLTGHAAAAAEEAYETCRTDALGKIQQVGIRGLTQLCRLPGIYRDFEECRMRVYENLKLYQELSALYQVRYLESFSRCQHTACGIFCRGLEKTFCPRFIV